MVLERVEFTAKDGLAAELLAALRSKSLPLLAAIPGCLAARAGSGVENPGKIILLVDWVSLDAHEAFKKMPDYAALLTQIMPFTAGAAAEHFVMA
jgi:quinol monooxygenase YgiN